MDIWMPRVAYEISPEDEEDSAALFLEDAVTVGKTHLQTVGVGKETALRVRVGNAQVGVETIARIAQHYAAVTLAAGGI